MEENKERGEMPQIRLKRAWTIATLLLLPLVLIGCAGRVIIHTIEKTDIFRINKGVVIGNQTVEKDGWFLSDSYVKEVAQAKIQ